MTDCLKEPVLFVGNVEENIDLSLPPTTGEEYIKRVIWEAQRCEDVVVAEIDQGKLKNQTSSVATLQGCARAPGELNPTLEWQQCQVADFANVRLYVARIKSELQLSKPDKRLEDKRLPNADDRSAWIDFCSGTVNDGSVGHDPTLSVVLSMNQPMIEQVLEYLVELVERQRRIEQNLGRWIYALLAVLEIPLNPNMYSCLRSLARICSFVRVNLDISKVQEAATSNLFICLVARYFRQLDLADP